jgi:hypothetical protein
VIEKMIMEELKRACDKNGSFASMAEAYGVLKEEYEEAKEEMAEIEKALDDYWGQCRKSPNHCGVSEILDIFGDRVQKCIMELVQLGAMVKKAQGLEGEKPRGEDLYLIIRDYFNKKNVRYRGRRVRVTFQIDLLAKPERLYYYTITHGVNRIKKAKVYPDISLNNIDDIVMDLEYDILLILKRRYRGGAKK